MSERAKLLLLVSAIAVTAFLFGLDVGAFEERMAESRRKVARYLADNFVESESGTFVPKPVIEPVPPTTGSGPEV